MSALISSAEGPILPASPSRSSSACCDPALINAIATAAILLSVIVVLRDACELEFLTRHVFHQLDVAEVSSMGIGIITLLYVAVVIKKNYDYEVPKKIEESPKQVKAYSEPVKRPKRKLKPVGPNPTKPATTLQPEAPPKKSIFHSIFHYWTPKVSNHNDFTAELIDRNNSGFEMNCFFYSILINMKIDNELAAEARRPLPWNPAKYFGKDSNGKQITFDTKSNQDYLLAAQKMRREIGAADLAEWNTGGFATTTNADGTKTTGFYEKWALITQTVNICHAYLPKPGKKEAFLGSQDSYNHPLLLLKLHAHIEQLMVMFPNLQKWNDVTSTFIEDGTTVWDDYRANKEVWYNDNGTLNDSTPIKHTLNIGEHLEFLSQLKASLNPLAEGHSRPQAERDAARVEGRALEGNTLPLLFGMHFVGDDQALLTQKNEWFTCLKNTLHENMGILVGKNRVSWITGEECVDCESASKVDDPELAEEFNAKKLTFKDCSDIATAINQAVAIIAAPPGEDFDIFSDIFTLQFQQSLWDNTMTRFGATKAADGITYTPPIGEERFELRIPSDTLKATILLFEKSLDELEDPAPLQAQITILRGKLNKIINNKHMVHQGLASEATIVDFLTKRSQANTQMSLLAINRASMLFKRTIVYSVVYPNGQGGLPKAVNSDVNGANMPFFFIHNTGNHWIALKRDEALALYNNCNSIFNAARNIQDDYIRSQAQQRAYVFNVNC